MADERNFRSYYYEKVGFRAVEEKKSIELLLKDKPLDVEKLRQYCLRFPVSARYRVYLWKIILGILPANQDSHDFVLKNRTEQYNHLRHALDVMRKVDNTTPHTVIFLKMFLIEEGLLPFNDNDLLSNPEYEAYVHIAKAILGMVENQVDAYWITNRFYRTFRKNYKECIPILVEKVKASLKKEDGNQKLIAHFDKHDMWKALPLKEWLNCGFASILPESSFERIGDILLGGSVMILIYIAVALFVTLRRPLLSMKSQEEMLKYLAQIPEDSGDVLVSKAIDMWEKHGHHLTKSDSPGPGNKSPTILHSFTL
ncbi:TBC1 domain family member 7-like [Mercenaria mercenaria]|uniref:TBC1 domain family member 7-like n=1 Tax=Mercenaria mercenaria TaxID=6596 RepID=UPI001E1DBF78|nr:TBC1 domain family member 7-like [Mercenaria mercenaria]XP_053384030.1 TBC1 domain family member 7-like [Mercenaria mercenaria]